MLSASFRSRVSNSLRVRAMFFSRAASSDSVVFNFSFAVRTASVLPMRARTSSARSSGRRARFAIIPAESASRSGGSGIKCVQIGKLFQKIAVGSFALLNAPLHAGKLSFAYLRSALRLVALLKERLFLCFEFRNCVRLLPRDLLAFFFNSFYSFVNPRDPQRDFFLLLFQFL